MFVDLEKTYDELNNDDVDIIMMMLICKYADCG